MSPAEQLIEEGMRTLQPHAPFHAMPAAAVRELVTAARLAYYAPGELVLAPSAEPPSHLLFVRQGTVMAQGGFAQVAGAETAHLFEAGDLLPLAAVAAQRPVTATYVAQGDVFALEIPAQVALAVASRCLPWADFMARRVQWLLERARDALRAEHGQNALAELALETPLAQRPELMARQLVTCQAHDSVEHALRLMQRQRVGSVVVVDAQLSIQGILTRHDVLDRITLPGVALSAPMHEVMSHPVHSLDANGSGHDAVLLMARHGVRHLPLTRAGCLVGIVSERDVFALQRRSLRHVSGLIRASTALPAWQLAGQAIRSLAGHLLTQGLAASTLTQTISRLNDQLTERIVTTLCAHHSLDLRRACWLSFGSEGRQEQTIATDQDNGLVLDDSASEPERQAWMAMAAQANAALDACGYPLCKGQIMARNPQYCLSAGQWHQRLDDWMQRGAPEDLLQASIFFDLRPLAGAADLAQALRQHITQSASGHPRFLKQMADNALQRQVALNWRGAVDTHNSGAHAWLDLKLGATALYVDAARLLALAQGVPHTGTCERLLACVGTGAGRVVDSDARAWVAGFDHLQLLRLRHQLQHAAPTPTGPNGPDLQDHVPTDGQANPNRIDVNTLHALDVQLLKAALHGARELQQRLSLDHGT